MSQLSIVFLIRALDFGGAQRQLVGLACGLHRRGHRVLVLTFYEGGPLVADLVNSGVSVLSLKKRHRWDLVGPLYRAAREVRRIRPDLLHGYLVDANLFMTLLVAALPGARVVWGVRSSGLDMTRYSRAVGALFRISTWLAGVADLIIANSESGGVDHIAAGYPADRLIVIPNGIDSNGFHPDADARDRARREWGFGAGELVIGLVGRLDPMKGHEVFLRAAARLLAERDDVRFVCVGNGPSEFRGRLESLGRDLGLADRLLWLPGRREMRSVYNALDLATSASVFGEGFPNVIGEAMACGTLCVVTAVGDSAAVVGDTGIVVPKGDPVALVEGWRRGLSWLVDPAHPQGRARVEKEFSLERMVDRTEEALASLVESPGRGNP